VYVKNNYRINILTLIFAHLLLIAYPLVSKTIHVHQGGNVHPEFSAIICIEQTEDICPVCNFEFYYFIASNPLTAIVYLQTLPVVNTPIRQIHFGRIINYYSLRAPPVA